MTEIEIQLLSDRFEADRAEIGEGKLLAHHEQALDQLQAAEEYLAAKYPGMELTLISFDPSTIFKSWGLLEFRAGGSDICQVRVFNGRDGYECKDTYTCLLLSAPYDRMLEDVLSKAGYPARARTCFYDAVGMELTAGSSVEDLLATYPRMPRNTHIYIEKSDYDSQAPARIRSCLHDGRYYGSYILYFVSSLDSGIDWLEGNRSQFEMASFQCFDL